MAAQPGLIHIGCAGWSLPREHWPAFTGQGTHLQRYATQFPCVEINSSFYRPHRPQTYQRWAESVPDAFRFSLKLPKTITHEHRLQGCEDLLDQFLAQCLYLGTRLGCILVQLPPTLAYDPISARRFFLTVRERYAGALVLEPRHASWSDAKPLLVELHISRAAADPSPIANGEVPGGWPGVHYWRLHGSPRIYYSAYEPLFMQQLALKLQAAARDGIDTWCIFDNTAEGHAICNALTLKKLLA
jgi:uncharacterized protein YecE (DUF72 family)